jgi:type I restriction enzyme S subunit
MIDQENGLPVGWVLLPIKSLGKTVTGNTPPTKELDNYGGDISFIKPSELVDQPVSAGRETISNKGAEKARIMPKGGVLVSCIGNLGKTAIAKRDVAFNQQINAILFNESVIPEYGFYYFQTANFRKDLESLASATTISIVNKSKFESISVPIAPPEQQQRIVAEIEKQFSRLDEAVAGLKRIQANLKRYRASVLKSAAEGKLTAEWRKQHPDTEPAEQLLQRILKERRAHWEQAELEKMQAAGKPPKDDKWKQKYKEPVAPDVLGLPALPEGWIWVSLSMLAENIQIGPFGSLLHKSDYVIGGIPLVNPSHIKGQKIIANFDLTIAKSKYDSLTKYVMHKNDIVMGRRGEMGRCAVVLDNEHGWLCGTGSLFIRLFSNTNPIFCCNVLSSKRIKNFLNENSIGTTMQNLNQKILHDIPIPICSLNEQNEAIQQIERRLSIADEVEQQINTNLKRAERLRQSILKKAFSGRLVPQDSNDESAGVLLEKIKQAQRA